MPNPIIITGQSPGVVRFTGTKPSSAMYEEDLTRLKREVCQAAIGLTRHAEPIEGICQVRR